MSKKSRRRNRRLLKAAALLGGLALATRGRGNQMSEKETVSDAQKASQLGTLKKKPTKVYQDDIMRGGTGVKASKSYPRLKVDSIGTVFKDGKDTGVGNKKTKFVNRDPNLGEGVGIYKSGKKVSDLNPNAINVLSDGSIMAKGITYPNRSAYMNRKKLPDNLTKGMGMDRVEGVNIPDENFKTSEFDYFAKGGRVKKKPFAKRGFGRAYKKGRK